MNVVSRFVSIWCSCVIFKPAIKIHIWYALTCDLSFPWQTQIIMHAAPVVMFRSFKINSKYAILLLSLLWQNTSDKYAPTNIALLPKLHNTFLFCMLLFWIQMQILISIYIHPIFRLEMHCIYTYSLLRAITCAPCGWIVTAQKCIKSRCKNIPETLKIWSSKPPSKHCVFNIR